MRFSLLFTLPFTNMHLGKDPGKIPEVVARRFNWCAEIIRCNSDVLDREDAEIPHVSVHDLSAHGQGSVKAAVLKYLYTNARSIDVLTLFHYDEKTLLYGLLYKILNPKGFLWNKLDLHEEYLISAGLITTSHNNPKRLVLYALQRLYLDKVDLISTESVGAHRILVDLYPWLQDKLAVIPNGIDTTTFSSAYSTERRKRYVLNVARLGTEQKGTDILLEAFAQSGLSPDWTLILVGSIEPNFRPWLTSFFERNPTIQSSVRLVGHLESPEDMARWYSQSVVFCLPSRYEGFPISLLEAGYYGCACVSTDYYAAVDVLDHGHFGVLCRKGNVPELATALKRVCGDESGAVQTGQALRKRVLSLYNWDHIADRIRDEILIRTKARPTSD